MERGKTYIAIDLKSFYASVECADRDLDPLTARLVVADSTRTEKTICLAVSPALKAEGIGGRARLFEVLQKVPRDSFIIAPPRMNRYMEISTKIFGIYAQYIAPEDIHVYSIDEVFMDVTNYLDTYKMSAHELAMTMIRDVLKQTGITATAGIGTNLYLAKVAMDIVAKHMPADKDGVRIAELDEMSYRKKLWNHEPITDFWRVGRGYAKRLNELYIHTMGDVARYSLSGSDKLYKVFGVNAELLIDHAWGWEPVEMSDIKNYRVTEQSLSSGQVLHCAYPADKARLVTWEMADALALEMVSKRVVGDQVILNINYDTENVTKGYKGEIETDHYGRKVPKTAHGSGNLNVFTSSSKLIADKIMEIYDRIVDMNLSVRKIGIAVNHIRLENEVENGSTPQQLDIFTDYDGQKRDLDKEHKCQEAMLKIKNRYGKNSILKAANFESGATMRERNRQVGGHAA